VGPEFTTVVDLKPAAVTHGRSRSRAARTLVVVLAWRCAVGFDDL